MQGKRRGILGWDLIPGTKACHHTVGEAVDCLGKAVWEPVGVGAEGMLDRGRVTSRGHHIHRKAGS